jgi:hypothetical protein
MNCELIIQEYLKWIKDNTLVKSIEGKDICSISTPFLDRHNDHLNIYLVKDGDNYLITDDGYTIADLRMSGMEINTPKRENILRTTLNGFGVKINPSDELFVPANKSNLGQKKHYLIQAILAVNDMFNLSQESVTSLFKDIKLTGKSGFDHNIDFLIPQTRTKPERLIKTVNSPKKNSILNAIMAFNDISQTRDTKTSNYVVYNDFEKDVSSDVIIALDNYNVHHIPWTHKEESLADFSMN